MPYSLWLDGLQLGTTELEAILFPGRRAGILQPTPQGIPLLPSITAIVPALFEFGAACEARGIDTSIAGDEHARATLDALADTGLPQRIQTVVGRIARLELRDARGANVPWTYILVTDMEDLRARAGALQSAVDGEAPPLPPVRYLISATLATDAARVGGAARPEALVS